MQGFFIALGVVFVAELGDKTQLVVLTMGARQRLWAALAGLFVTILILQALAVSVGAAIAAVVPEKVIGIGAGLLFLGFAVWTWLEARKEEADDDVESSGGSRTGVIGMCAAFFVAELGDKTQLTAAALAADHNPIATWAGATLGLFGATVLALVAGRFLAGRVPPGLFAKLGAGAFAIVGVITLVAALR